jgi:hypothetical protein
MHESAPDGLSSSSTSIGVANPATSLTTLGSGGNMSQKQVSPDGSYTISTVVAGRPDVTAFYDNTNTLIASSATRDATNTFYMESSRNRRNRRACDEAPRAICE